MPPARRLRPRPSRPAPVSCQQQGLEMSTICVLPSGLITNNAGSRKGTISLLRHTRLRGVQVELVHLVTRISLSALRYVLQSGQCFPR